MYIEPVKARNMRVAFPWRILLKLAAPSIVVLSLLSYGIYLGSANRDRVLKFEREYLGLNVEQKSLPEVPEQPAAAAVLWNPPLVEESVEILPQKQVVDPVARDLPRTELISTGAVDDLRAKRDLPITIRIKVLVDDEYLARHPVWMVQIQATFGEASRVFRDNFGIDLALVSVGRWPQATDGHNASQLHKDLLQMPREGADVLLGFVNRELDGVAYSLGNASKNRVNGGCGLVGLTLNSDSFLHGLLRSLGHLLGAREVVAEETEEFVLGTWMSSNPISSGTQPWIDGANRRRILENKTRPFASSDRGINR